MKNLSNLHFTLIFFVLLASSCQPSSPIPPVVFSPDAESRIDTLSVPSPAMDTSIPAIVVLPATYEEDNNRRFPVVYLLHGATGNYTDWTQQAPQLSEYADQNGLIIVCPDGGYTSWYFDSPVDSQYRYETHITREVIPYVDAHYRTQTGPAHRAITGLSMGGHGALYLAARHPDLFGAAGSMSGGVDIRPFPDNWDIKNRLGSLDEFPERWESGSVVNYDTAFARNEQALIIDCGVDDFFFEVNEELHQRLMSLNVGHDYITRPGEHNWAYWRNAVVYQLLFFKRFFESGEH